MHILRKSNLLIYAICVKITTSYTVCVEIIQRLHTMFKRDYSHGFIHYINFELIINNHLILGKIIKHFALLSLWESGRIEKFLFLFHLGLYLNSHLIYLFQNYRRGLSCNQFNSWSEINWFQCVDISTLDLVISYFIPISVQTQENVFAIVISKYI